MKLLNELISVRRIDVAIPSDELDQQNPNACPPCASDDTESTETNRSNFEDEGAGVEYIVCFDYSGQGRELETVAGPFATSDEAQAWIEDNGHTGDDRFMVDINGWPDQEDEETGLGRYDQIGNAVQGAPIDTEPEGYEDGQPPDEEDDLASQQEEDPGLDAMANKASEDPDRQGLIRKVPKAHLVYKRQTEEGQYEELWIYNAGEIKDELTIRKAILAGTDIPVTKTKSPDGAQQYEMWTTGNVEMLLIKGLPN